MEKVTFRGWMICLSEVKFIFKFIWDMTNHECTDKEHDEENYRLNYDNERDPE